jgi:hypothetical protein
LIPKITIGFCTENVRDEHVAINNKREYSLGYEPRESLLWIALGYAKKYCKECEDEKYLNTIVRVFNTSDELSTTYKNDVDNSFHFLQSFVESMEETVEEKKKNIAR